MIDIDTLVSSNGTTRWVTVKVANRARTIVVEEAELVVVESRSEDDVASATIRARRVALARARQIHAALTEEVSA